MALATRRSGSEVLVEVHVAPRSSRAAVLGEHGGALKVAVTAPPVEGAANRAVCELLAEALGIPRSRLRVVRGHRARRKTVAIAGIDEATVAALVGSPA
jgi:hypothetical protein